MTLPVESTLSPTASDAVATSEMPRAALRGGSIALAARIVFLVVAVSIPLLFKNFVVFQFTQMLVYAIAILGLNLLTGINGQFSLGHSAFYALGAYTAAILMDQYSISYIWTLPAAGVICFTAGFLFGLPALRLEGIYLALATFSLAITTPQIL